MMLIPTAAPAFAAVLLSATLVQAGETKPAIVFDTGGKFDKSFNEGVANGAERFKKETGIAPIEFEVTNHTQFEQAIPVSLDRKSTRLNSSHSGESRMPSSA